MGLLLRTQTALSVFSCSGLGGFGALGGGLKISILRARVHVRVHVRMCVCMRACVFSIYFALGRSWGVLGRSWALLGRSWGHAGPILQKTSKKSKKIGKFGLNLGGKMEPKS